jgi:hypothetical protein
LPAVAAEVAAEGPGVVASAVEAAASGAAEDFGVAPRFVAALEEASTAGLDSAGALTAEADLTVDLASALALATGVLAIRISGMAMVTLAATAIRTSATTTRITPITGAPEWAFTAERITDRRRSSLAFCKHVARDDRGVRANCLRFAAIVTGRNALSLSLPPSL